MSRKNVLIGLLSINSRALLIVLLAVMGLAGSMFYINSHVFAIKSDLDDMRKQVLPLSRMVDEMDGRQLKQSLYFERALHFGTLIATDAEGDKKRFLEARDGFERTSRTGIETLMGAQKIVTGAVTATKDPGVLETFLRFATILQEIEVQQADYMQNITLVFDKLSRGGAIEFEATQVSDLEKEKAVISNRIEMLRDEIGRFAHIALSNMSSESVATTRILWTILGMSALVLVVILKQLTLINKEYRKKSIAHSGI